MIRSARSGSRRTAWCRSSRCCWRSSAPAPLPHDRMDNVDRDGLAREIYDRTHLTGEFVLRSGAVSQRVLRRVPSRGRPGAAPRASVRHCVRWSRRDRRGRGARARWLIPLATMLSRLACLQGGVVREEAEDLGACQLAEVGEVDEQRLCGRRSMVSSGGRIVLSTEDLARARRTSGAVIVVDRHGPDQRRALADGGSTCARASRWTTEAGASADRSARPDSLLSDCLAERNPQDTESPLGWVSPSPPGWIPGDSRKLAESCSASIAAKASFPQVSMPATGHGRLSRRTKGTARVFERMPAELAAQRSAVEQQRVQRDSVKPRRRPSSTAMSERGSTSMPVSSYTSLTAISDGEYPTSA